MLTEKSGANPFSPSIFHPLPVLRLWPDKAPGEKGDVGEEKVLPTPPNEARPITRLTNVSDPTITIHRPPKPAANGRGGDLPGRRLQHPGDQP